MLRTIFQLVVSVLAVFFAYSSLLAVEFQLRDGDRVVLLGDSLVEQEQYYGWLEILFTTSFPDVDATFRNLGWNADTPSGSSRFGLSWLQAGREPAEEGWKQLQSQLELTKPTLLVLGYGLASALEGGAEGVDEFARAYQRLLNRAAEISPGVRFLLLSPLAPLHATPAQTELIEAYSDHIRLLAVEQQVPYVDLRLVAQSGDLRKNSLHLNEAGYQNLALYLAEQLSLGTKWQESPRTEALRETILRKNEWWFHRSRPANMAYVFGFRKHEQGQNAVEIPQFDELIASEEALIARLRRLAPVRLPERVPRLESQYAEFTAQPRPEFIVAEGWEVNLWAENPLLNKPIHMNFDPQGRLWVASSEAYPMIEVGQAAPDKVLMLEDTTGDGQADKSTVFAEGLLIPTGILPGDGGIYVAQSTDLLFLQDTDGDGRADVKQRVLSGFGTEDTHHNLHTLLWGPDGRLYMNQSIYTRTDMETPHGVVRLKAGGGFRLDTRTLRAEVFFRGLVNSWGHQFDAYGQSFLTDGAGFQGIAYTFPGAIFNPTPGARRQLDLISPGRYPKFAALEIVQGDAFPPDWQGALVTCDFRANRVTRFRLFEQESGFVTEQQEDLLRTSASSFRPIDVKQGPDGAIYIADWSNPIINHGEVDFRDSRRDRWHGRIWRVVWKGGKQTPKVDLTQLTDEQLLGKLSSDDRFARDQARRVLVERGQLTPALVDQWLSTQFDVSVRLQGLWLHQALNSTHTQLLEELLSVDEPAVRAAATRVLSVWADPTAVAYVPVDTSLAHRLLAERLHDIHPRVRLEAIHGLARLGTAQAGFTALEVLSLPMDRFLEFALAEAVERLAEPLMAAIDSGSWQADSPERQAQLEFVLTAIEPQRASHFLRQRLATHPISRDGAGPWIELIGRAGGTEELTQLCARVIAGEFNTPATVRALRALADAERLRKQRPHAVGSEFPALLTADEADIQLAAVQLVGLWKLRDQVTLLTSLAAAGTNAMELRQAAVDALAAIGKGPAVEALAQLAASGQSLPIRKPAILALARLDPARVAQPFYEVLAQVDSEGAALEMWRGVLVSSGAGAVLAASMPAQTVTQIAARAGVRVAREGGRNESELLAALTPLSGMTVTAAELSPERIVELVELASTRGDANRGEEIYRRQDLACTTCHALGGVGGKVGPDMTSLGASAPVDYIIESLFNPNAKIKEGFHSVTVATEDGLIVNGIAVESSDTEIVLRNVANNLVRIAKNEILDTQAGASLMPAGVVDRLELHEQLDLIRFLSVLGKPGPFDASQGGVARRLEVLAGNHRLEQQGADRIITGQLNEGWKPLYSRVNGDVLGAELAELTEQPPNISLVNVYLRTQATVAQDGVTTITFMADTPVSLWVDAEPISGKKTLQGTAFAINSKAGQHTVLLRLDARKLPERFRLVSDNVSFAIDVE